MASVQSADDLDLSFQSSPFFNVAVVGHVGPLEPAEAYDLVHRPLHGLLSYSVEAMHSLLELTGGYPFLIQQLCSAVLGSCRQKLQLTVDATDIDAAADKVIESGHFYFVDIVRSLDHEGRAVFDAAVSAGRSGQSFSKQSLRAQLAFLSKEIPHEGVDRGLEVLIQKNVLLSEQGNYRFDIGLFRKLHGRLGD